jgi:deoxyribodipyrimidine photo-lyase
VRKPSFPAKKIWKRTIFPKTISDTKNYSILPSLYALSRMHIMVNLLDRTVPLSVRPKAVKRLVSSDRHDLIARVRNISPNLATGDTQISEIRGGRAQADSGLVTLNPSKYGSTRNHLDGSVTRLSPYIRHGVLNLTDVRDRALNVATAKEAEKFIQQLAWREYWQRLYKEYPDRIWRDVEPYKTGFEPSDYIDELPEDIAEGRTGIACIDGFISELLRTGYIHNHARLYLAGYICHWRRVKWQAGARWFLQHLLDGDPASNNLSWQWVASTFSHKPYYFNLDNVAKFSGDDVDTCFARNKPLAGTYEDLYERLFPNLEPQP